MELLPSFWPHRGIALGAFVWFGKRGSLTRRPLLPLNAGTAEPVRVSPPEAVASLLEFDYTASMESDARSTGGRVGRIVALTLLILVAIEVAVEIRAYVRYGVTALDPSLRSQGTHRPAQDG